jgi:hypothetical protein
MPCQKRGKPTLGATKPRQIECSPNLTGLAGREVFPAEMEPGLCYQGAAACFRESPTCRPGIATFDQAATQESVPET